MIHIKRFFEHNSCRGSITSAELLAFKKACSDEEWAYFISAAEAANKAAGI